MLKTMPGTSKRSHFVNFNLNIFIMLLIIIQSCGIRFFDGQGSLLGVIILALVFYKGVNKFNKADQLILVSVVTFLIISGIIHREIPVSKTLFQAVLFAEAFFFLKTYSNHQFVRDLYDTLTLVFLHSIIGYCLYFIIPWLFVSIDYSGRYLTLGNLFFVVEPISGSIKRNTGICWEPGLLQLMMNIYLFYSIRAGKSIRLILSICVVIITTFSTAGFLIIGLNYIYFVIINYYKKTYQVILSLACLLVFSGVLFIIRDNIADKLNGENTSGLTRYRDALIGYSLLKERPLTGHGLFDKKYLLSKGYVRSIDSDIFSKEYIEGSGDLAGGYTNGFLGLFNWYGIPVGLYLFYILFKNRFVSQITYERIIFFLILCITFISEPITYTSFFLLFVLSHFFSEDSDHLKFKGKKLKYN